MTDYRSIPPDEPVEYLVVYRASDATDGEMTAMMLIDHGIKCRLLGTRNASLVGIGGQIAPLRIEVPAHRATEARELIAAMRAPAVEDEEDDLPKPRRAILAIGCTILFFGGSHFYARRPWTGAMLAITQLSALLLWRTPEWPSRPIAIAAVPSILLLDCVFGVRAARAHNEGARPTPLRQAFVGLLWATAAALVATIYALRVAA